MTMAAFWLQIKIIFLETLCFSAKCRLNSIKAGYIVYKINKFVLCHFYVILACMVYSVGTFFVMMLMRGFP